MKRTFLPGLRVPVAALAVAAWSGAAWLGCDTIAGIKEGTLAEGGTIEGGVEGGPPLEASPDTQVSNGPDFTVALDAPLVGVVQGGTGSVGVTITPVDGFAGAVSVKVTGMPSGVSPDSLTINAGQTTGTLTLSALSSATLGDGPQLTVTATSGAISHTADLALLVQGPSGSLDTTFNGQGFLNGEGTSAYGGMALQPDGKIVLCGQENAKPTGYAFAARYNVDGTPDVAFGAPGAGPDAGQTLVSVLLGLNSSCGAVTLVPSSGDILLAGTSTVPNDALVRVNGWVAALTPAGALDTQFGDGGIAWWPEDLSELGSVTAVTIALDANGNILSGGSAGTKPVLVRLTSKGAIDTTFGTSGSGYALGAYPKSTENESVVATAGGNPLVSLDMSASATFAVQRFTTAGQLDSTFFSQGTAVVSPDLASTAFGLALQHDGNIVAAGQAIPTQTDASTTYAVAVARFLSSGNVDTQYGPDGGGSAVVALGPAGQSSWADSVALDPWGRAVVSGSIPSTQSTFGVARFTTSGALDTTFAGGQGYVSTQVGGVAGSAEAFSVAVMPDGRIVAAGTYSDGHCFPPAPCNEGILVVARYWP